MSLGKPPNYQPRYPIRNKFDYHRQLYANMRTHPFDPHHHPNEPHPYMYTDYPEYGPYPPQSSSFAWGNKYPPTQWIPPPFPPAPPLIIPLPRNSRADPEYCRTHPMPPWIPPSWPPPEIERGYVGPLRYGPPQTGPPSQLPRLGYPKPNPYLAEFERKEAEEAKRSKDMAWEKIFYKRAKEYAADLEYVRQHRLYPPEVREALASQGMTPSELRLAQYDKLDEDMFLERYYRDQAEKKTKQNIWDYGYSQHDQEQERQNELQEALQKQRQEEMWQRYYDEEQRKERASRGYGFASGLFFAVFGILWFLVQGLVSLLSVVVMTFWNRYQEYDVPAAPTPQQQRPDDDILNAQLQREMCQEQPHPENQPPSGDSWTDSAANIPMAILNGLWRLIIALIYSVWQLAKAPLRAAGPFVLDNLWASCFFSVFLFLFFNPWGSNPYKRAIQNYNVGPPPPPRVRFPPPDLASFPGM